MSVATPGSLNLKNTAYYYFPSCGDDDVRLFSNRRQFPVAGGTSKPLWLLTSCLGRHFDPQFSREEILSISFTSSAGLSLARGSASD